MLSYKTTEPLSDLRKISTDDSVWGRSIVNSFSTAGDGKGNIDGEAGTSYVLYTNRVAIKPPAGLGSTAMDLEKVVEFMNSNFTHVKDSKAKFGPHRSGPRIWRHGRTSMYDQARSEAVKLETLLSPNGDRILRPWFCFVAVDGKLYGRRRSCFDCMPCYESEFLDCRNTIKCGPWVELDPVEIEGTSRERSFLKRLNQPEGTTLKKVSSIFIHNIDFDKIDG